MSDQSNGNKKRVSSHYNPVTHETTITYNDGTTSTFTGNGRSLGAGVNVTSSSNSPKMRKINEETDEDKEQKS